MMVGHWRVVSRRGHGAYGVVYRVQSSERPEVRSFALKLARYPMDPRFEREVGLLSRFQHAHVPRLHDHGEWTRPEGLRFPFLVMDWVEGVPLYEWGARNRPTSRQVMRLVAQLARALEGLHGVSGVHRDVKGDNVLVTEDAQAFLMDFGSGIYPGAHVLTHEPVPPGTPQYWGPEVHRFEWRFQRHAGARYQAGPADDIYALGMTAWRLVTGTYPPLAESADSIEDDTEWVFGRRVQPEALAGVCPELAALICQMLSHRPSARGQAGEIAQALERAVKTAGCKADRPIPPHSTDWAPVRSARLSRGRSPLGWGLGLAVAVGGLLLSINSGSFEQEHTAVAQEDEEESQQADGGTAGMAEAVLSARMSAAPSEVVVQTGISLDMPKEPLPGQRRPPCTNREVAINGGCWVGPSDVPPPCALPFYEWKNGCYVPTFGSRRSPTSDQQ